MLLGTVIFGCGGWVWGAVLITFFGLSSLLSHHRKAAKKTVNEVFSKSGPRDLGQTLANGGVGAMCALATLWWDHPVLLAAFVGAIATVNADTWATEIGILSSTPPRLITTWKPVAPGTSGGISLVGTLATAGGALTIGLATILFLSIDSLLGTTDWTTTWNSSLWIVPTALLGGLIGSLADSLLGATSQAIYFSTALQRETERPTNSAGVPNSLIRGRRLLGNDGVNFTSSLVGSVIAALVWFFLRH